MAAVNGPPTLGTPTSEETPLRVRTGLVTPSPDGPHVEQVGWGVGRQVVRVLREHGADHELLDRFADLAETPGHLAYAVFRGRAATAVALLRLPGETGDAAAYLGSVLTAEAAPGTREALLVRALHDVGAAGVAWLQVPAAELDLGPFGGASDDDRA